MSLWLISASRSAPRPGSRWPRRGRCGRPSRRSSPSRSRASAGSPSSSARLSRIAAFTGPSFGSWAKIVTSTLTTRQPGLVQLRERLGQEEPRVGVLPLRVGVGVGSPMSPRPAAPSRASVTACSTTSASLWPTRPRGCSIARRRGSAAGPRPGGACRGRSRCGSREPPEVKFLRGFYRSVREWHNASAGGDGRPPHVSTAGAPIGPRSINWSTGSRPRASVADRHIT